MSASSPIRRSTTGPPSSSTISWSGATRAPSRRCAIAARWKSSSPAIPGSSTAMPISETRFTNRAGSSERCNRTHGASLCAWMSCPPGSSPSSGGAILRTGPCCAPPTASRCAGSSSAVPARDCRCWSGCWRGTRTITRGFAISSARNICAPGRKKRRNRSSRPRRRSTRPTATRWRFFCYARKIM